MYTINYTREDRQREIETEKERKDRRLDRQTDRRMFSIDTNNAKLPVA